LYTLNYPLPPGENPIADNNNNNNNNYYYYYYYYAVYSSFLCTPTNAHNLYKVIKSSIYAVAYPGIFSGRGVQQIRLRTGQSEWGVGPVAP
jgi:hypothetical protein